MKDNWVIFYSDFELWVTLSICDLKVQSQGSYSYHHFSEKDPGKFHQTSSMTLGNLKNKLLQSIKYIPFFSCQYVIWSINHTTSQACWDMTFPENHFRIFWQKFTRIFLWKVIIGIEQRTSYILVSRRTSRCTNGSRFCWFWHVVKL